MEINNDVSQSLNITKPALYNYFKSKNDILLGCHLLGHDIIDASLVEIDQGTSSGLEKLQALIRTYAGIMTQKFGMCLVRLDDHALPPKAREIVRKRRRRTHDYFKSYLQAGIEDGSIDPCEVNLTALEIAGALNWISFWFESSKGLNAAQIGDYFAFSLTRGVASNPKAMQAPAMGEAAKRK